MEASGFWISCASDALSAATASSRSARGVELLHFLQVGDVGEDRGHRRRLLRLLTEGGGAEADREDPPALVGHHPLAPADLAAVPDSGDDRRPELRRPGLELVQHRQADERLALEIEQLSRRSG